MLWRITECRACYALFLRNFVTCILGRNAYYEKIISIFLLSAILLFSFSVSGLSAEEISDTLNDMYIAANKKFNKIHFYFNNEEHSIIDSLDELKLAVNSLVETRNSAQSLDNISSQTVEVTVQFKSAFMQTKKYNDFLDERETLKT